MKELVSKIPLNFLNIIKRAMHFTNFQNTIHKPLSVKTIESILPSIEYEIFGEGSHISTNQRRESTVFSLLIG